MVRRRPLFARATEPRGRLPAWRDSATRQELLAIYSETDALLAGWSCACSNAAPGDARLEPRCCHFGVLGREPYPTAVEMAEVRRALRSSPRPAAPDANRRALPLVELGACPLLDAQGRCGIYDARPFGCRTFFCDGAESPSGARARLPRSELRALGQRIAELSARFAPDDPRPRPLTRALADRRANQLR